MNAKKPVVDFDIYECAIPGLMAPRTIHVLATSMQRVIETVPKAFSIKRISSTLPGAIVVNNDVAIEISKTANEKSEKKKAGRKKK